MSNYEMGYCYRTRTQWVCELVNYDDDAQHEMEIITLETLTDFVEVE